jgi:DNA polymerase-3 subunit delta
VKISLNLMNQDLLDTQFNIYLISSNELLLSQDAEDMISKSLISKGYSFGTRESHSRTFDILSWAERIFSPSLFASAEFHFLHINSFSIKDDELISILNRFRESGLENTSIIIHAPFVTYQHENKVWIKYIIEHGLLVQCWPIQDKDFPSWIQSRAKKLNITLTINAAITLASLSENNLYAANNLIHTLSLDPLKVNFDENDVIRISDNASSFDAYKLADAVLECNEKKIFRIYYMLRKANVPLPQILYAIFRDFKILYNIILDQDDAKNRNLDLSKYGVWKKRQPMFLLALKYYDKSFIELIFHKIFILEKSIKGVEDSSGWDELTKFLNSIFLKKAS